MMTEEEYKKYKEALLLFYGGGRYILNNRFLPGIPTLPDIQEYTITFTNLDYPDLPIDIPEPITDISGTVVTLPTMSGEYEDTYNYYTPDSWSIGSFGEEIELSDNLIANLIFNVVPKVITYTLSFVNIEYPDFDVSLPDSIIGPEGTEITLPEVEGEFIEDDYIYTPSSWSIGSFGSSYILNENSQAELLWNVVPVQQENVIGGLISETESIDWKSISVLGNMEVDNVNLYSELTQFGTLSVDNIALTQDFYMLGKLMHDYDPAIEDATFIVYDSLSDNIVSFFNQELTLSEVQGIVLDSPELIIGVPQTVPNRSFFFTENGREETNNTSLEIGSTLPLYDEYGNLITDEETITLYDNSQALSFMKEDGNMEQALNSDLLVDNDGELSLQLSSQTRSRSVEQEETITIESTFGAEITIPEGYEVESVQCQRLYVKASNVTHSLMNQYVTFSFNGENEFCNDSDTTLLALNTNPCLGVFAFTSLTAGFYITYPSIVSPTTTPMSISYKLLNSNGVFVGAQVGWSATDAADSVATGLRTYPALFRRYDTSGNFVPYYFKIQQSVWQFQNGTFTWLGNVSDTSDLAYWYNTRPVKINLSLKQVSREITAWSVQTERVFVLQFSNSEHPSLDIPMPSNETGYSGTVITLPTVIGEYTEEGMVYTPVAWNIGAFGDSYTLNNDVTAILQLSSRVALPTVYSYSGTQTESSVAPDASIDTGLTYDSGNLYLGETNDGQGNATRYGWEAEEGPEPPAYTEITLYYSETYKRYQGDVTSGFTGNVSSGYCYQLYTDEQCTIPWSGYDYSNDYEVGLYNDGAWEPRISKIEDMPSTTTDARKNGFILMDTGCMWHCSNVTDSARYNANMQVVIRIYPKGQQFYAFYKGSTSNSYENGSLSNGNISGLKGKPYISNVTQQTVPWGVQDSTLPVRTLQKVLGSAGNELSLTGLDWRDPSLGYNFYQLANNSGSSVSFRTVLFTLSTPTLNAYTTIANSDVSVAASGVSLYFGDGSGKIPYDSSYSYRVIGLFKANGDAANGTWSVVNDFVIYDDGSGKMAIKRNTNSGVALKRVWYTKTIKPIETTFGADVTIPAGYEVESVTCSRGYAFASNVTGSTMVQYELLGENLYFDSTNTSLIGVLVAPALQISVIYNSSGTVRATLSCKSGYSGKAPTSASADYVNSGGYFVKGKAVFGQTGDTTGTLVVSDMQTYPIYFNLSDSSGNWLYFCFRVPQTLWQFQNGTFSWLGDTTDSSDLAYWYNTRAVRINLRPITT